jgi:hypothetical protein
LCLDWDVNPAVLLGETLGLDDALLSSPGEALYPQTDDVNCELRRFGMEVFAKLAG